MLTILINLDDAIQRRQTMDAHLSAAGVVATRLGIDLRQSTPDDVQRWFASHHPGIRFVPGSMCAAEAGCWASHVAAWKHLLASGEPSCTVLEDDIVLVPGFREAVASLVDPAPFDVVYLGTSSRNISTRRRHRVGDAWVHESLGVVFNTWGYVITRAYVERFFAAPHIRVDQPIDHFLGGRAKVVKPRTGVIRPALVAEDPSAGLHSQIQPYATRMDRHPWWQAARRAILASRLSDLYYSIYRWL